MNFFLVHPKLGPQSTVDTRQCRFGFVAPKAGFLVATENLHQPIEDAKQMPLRHVLYAKNIISPFIYGDVISRLRLLFWRYSNGSFRETTSSQSIKSLILDSKFRVA